MDNPRRGFSLVELMIVVAIVGILAAIAVPNFTAMQYRAKRAEAPGNVDDIKGVQLAYEAAYDAYLDCTESPNPLAGDGSDRVMKPWADAGTGFTILGWRPEGEVRGAYSAIRADGTPAPITIYGRINADGDGAIAEFTATESLNVQLNGLDSVY